MMHRDLNSERDLIDDVVDQLVIEEETTTESTKVNDFVDVIYAEPKGLHAKTCAASNPFVNSAGIIYCLTCGRSIGSLADTRDFLCSSCGCPLQNHQIGNGPCLSVIDGKKCPCLRCTVRVTKASRR